MRIHFIKNGSTAATVTIVLLLGAACSVAQDVKGADRFQIAPKPIRKICDPHTGMQWVLERDPSNQGRPGRMILDKDESCHRTTSTAQQDVASSDTSGRQQKPAFVPVPVVIRVGDKLVLEETTPQVETRLEAVALTSAAPGAEFTARLTFQGAIVHAVALEPGRATMGRPLGLPRRQE